MRNWISWTAKPSPAMGVALVALMLSCAGGAYAVNIGRNAVKSRNIAPNAVRSSDIAPNAVRGRDVLESSLTGVNASRLGGRSPGGYAKVFVGSAEADDPETKVYFTIPGLKASVIADNSVATTTALRVRNEGVGVVLSVGRRTDVDGPEVEVGPGSVSSNQNFSSGPFMITSGAAPGLTLVVSCGGSIDGSRCVGFLAGG